MSRKAAKGVPRQDESQSGGHGRAYALGWGLFLAFVALTPLVIGALPPQVGSLATVRAFDPFDLPKVVIMMVLCGLSLAALCVSWVRGESELYWHPVMWVLLALIGWAGISTIFAASPALSVWGSYSRYDGLVALFGDGLVAFLAIHYVRSTRALGKLMVVAVVSGSVVAMYTILQNAGIDIVPWANDAGRVFSTFGNADMLGNYLLFPFVLAIGLALSAADRRHSIGWWATAALNGMALYATLTRGAWIGALVALICLGVAGWQGAWPGTRRVRLLLAGVAAAILATASAVIVLIRPRASGSAASLSSTLERISNGRTIIWLTGLRSWLERPITGWGPDGFTRAFDSAVGADWYAIVDGAPGVDNAHNFLIQRLVTLGLPGLALTVWALVQTAVESFRGLARVSGGSRMRLASLWAVLVGLTTALFFGVSVTIVSVWLWLTVGLLLAPLSHRIRPLPKAVFAMAAGLGVALALWAGTWLVADVIVGRAAQLPPGPEQIAALDSAVRLNPLAQSYRWQAAEAVLNETLAEQKAGQSAVAVDQMMLGVLSRYDGLVNADPGDALVRVAYANILVSYAARHPGSDAAQRAVEVALQASQRAPRSAAVLVVLARAYRVAGRLDDAEKTARLARSIAPAYAAQTLGSLGLDGSSTQ